VKIRKHSENVLLPCIKFLFLYVIDAVFFMVIEHVIITVCTLKMAYWVVAGGTAAAAPTPFRPGNPALCGSHPLVTSY